MPTPASRTPVRIARGTYANLAASLADLNEGEICFATDEEALYVKNGGSLVASGGTSVTTSDTAPSTPSDGDLWYDSVSGRLFIYYQDPSGSQWVDASPQGGGSAGITVSDSAPSSPSNGDLWYRSSDGRLYVYYDDGSTSQWVDAAPQGGGGSGTSITAGNTSAEVIDTGSDGRFVVTTEGSERLRVDSSGRLGIGNTTAGSYNAGFNQLVVGSSGDQGVTIVSGTSNSGTLAFADGTSGADAYRGYVQYQHGSTNALVFATDGSERFRCDSSGRLLVGTSTARANFYNSTQSAFFQVEGTGSNRRISVIADDSSGAGAGILLGAQRSNAVGGNTIVANNDDLGTVTFQGNDGTEFVEAAAITAQVDGTPGANDMPGRLVFSTTSDGASSPTERMRITSDGAVLIGTTSTSGQGRKLKIEDSTSASNNGPFHVVNTNTSADRVCTIGINNSGGGTLIAFDVNGVAKGSITTNGSTISYNTSSDYRLKENVSAVSDGITRLQQLKPSRFNFIADPAKTVDGFLAHEAAEVVPECVTGEKDAVDDEGNPIYQGIDQSKLVPLLTAALQELVAEVESLKTEVAALKAQ